uniref:heat shock 70 kDa protein 4L-like n=1 Tax=Styela clava TaxID=7725 RepID=UPI001939537B|nr:heat shock 70 kDa protein 4L-like [Styela clava]
MIVLGIDLGTSYTCVAAYCDGKVDIVTNDQEKRLTPSCVAFNDVERLYGNAALQQEFINMENTICGFKRFMGRCREKSLGEETKFPLGNDLINQENKFSFLVRYRNEELHFYPEEISAMLLAEVKKMAQNHFHVEVTQVVISVPTSFNDAQRQATVDAAYIAGLDVLALINAPTAAILSYGLENKVSSSNVLLFDLGSCNLNVAVVNIKEGIFRIFATKGYCNFGGDDFDSRLVDHFVEEFNDNFQVDMSKDKRAMNRLRKACERAKRTLSGSEQASIGVDALFDGKDFDSAVTREKFEELNESLFQKAITSVDVVLNKAKMTTNQIDEILLVGGSTRIPRLRELLAKVFEKTKLNRMINPDEAIARGAAFMAENIKRQRKGFIVQDISTFSIGVKRNNCKMIEIIQGNAEIPSQQWYKINEGFTSPVYFQVNEFEETSMEDAQCLASYMCFPSNLELNAPIEISFELNGSGILTVLGYQKNQKLSIIYGDAKGRLTYEVTQKLADRVQSFDRDDEEWRDRSKAKNTLENYVYDVKKSIRDRKYKNKMTAEEKSDLNDKCDEVLEWIENSKNAAKELSMHRQEELEDIWLTILSRIDPKKADEIRIRKEAEQRKKLDALNTLKESVTLFSKTIEEPGYKENSTEEDKSIIRWLYDAVMNWLSGNTNADVTSIEKKTKEVERYGAPIFERITKKQKAQDEERKREQEIKLQKLKKKRKDLERTVTAINNKMSEAGKEMTKVDKDQIEVQFLEAEKMINRNDATITELTNKERAIHDLLNSICSRIKKEKEEEEQRFKEIEESRIEARGILKQHLRDLVKLTTEQFKNDPIPEIEKQKIGELESWIKNHTDAVKKTFEEKDKEVLAMLNYLKSQDEESKKIIEAKERLKNTINRYKELPNKPGFKQLSTLDGFYILDACDSTEKWLNANGNAPVSDLIRKTTNLNQVCTSKLAEYIPLDRIQQYNQGSRSTSCDDVSRLIDEIGKLSITGEGARKQQQLPMATGNRMDSTHKLGYRKTFSPIDQGAKAKLQKCIADITENIEKVDQAHIKKECIKLRKSCEETHAWLQKHPNCSQHMYEMKMNKLNKDWDRVLPKLREKEKETSETSTSLKGRFYKLLNSFTGKETHSQDSASLESGVDSCSQNRTSFKIEKEKQGLNRHKPGVNTSWLEKEKLVKYTSTTENQLLLSKTYKKNLRPEEKRRLDDKCREISKLLSPNTVNLEAEDYAKKNRELHEIVEPILQRLGIPHSVI